MKIDLLRRGQNHGYQANILELTCHIFNPTMNYDGS
jgi:hypothetical protein